MKTVTALLFFLLGQQAFGTMTYVGCGVQPSPPPEAQSLMNLAMAGSMPGDEKTISARIIARHSFGRPYLLEIWTVVIGPKSSIATLEFTPSGRFNERKTISVTLPPAEAAVLPEKVRVLHAAEVPTYIPPQVTDGSRFVLECRVSGATKTYVRQVWDAPTAAVFRGLRDAVAAVDRKNPKYKTWTIPSFTFSIPKSGGAE